MDTGTLNFKRYFYISIIISALLISSFICLVGAILMIGGYVDANIIENSIKGTGDLYVRHDSKDASDLLSIINATVVYSMSRVWDETSTVFSTGVIINGADSSGGFRNQYVVKGSGAGSNHIYRATCIVGEYVGSGEITVKRNEDSPDTLDSLILMDSRKGNATFQGRIKSSVKGRPITDEEVDAVGQFAIRSYLNISEPIENTKGWLDFCESLNRIIDPKVAPGIYMAPANWSLDETGNLIENVRKS